MNCFILNKYNSLNWILATAALYGIGIACLVFQITPPGFTHAEQDIITIATTADIGTRMTGYLSRAKAQNHRKHR